MDKNENKQNPEKEPLTDEQMAEVSGGHDWGVGGEMGKYGNWRFSSYKSCPKGVTAATFPCDKCTTGWEQCDYLYWSTDDRFSCVLYGHEVQGDPMKILWLGRTPFEE